MKDASVFLSTCEVFAYVCNTVLEMCVSNGMLSCGTDPQQNATT